MKLFSKTLSVLSTLALVSCMGGTTDRSTGGNGINAEEVTFGSAITGQFVDAPVNGLNYYINSSTTPNQTTGEGNFNCTVGDSVTFKLGQNLVLGTAACGTLVAPTYFGDAIADKIAVVLQNMGRTPGTNILDVSAAANESFAINNISAVDATTIGPVLAKVGRSLSTDYATAVTAARTAMNTYLQSISQIPEAYRNNTYTFNVTANLVNGNRDLCDDTSKFKTVVEVGQSSANVKFYGVEDDGTVTAQPILQSIIYSTTFHVGGSIDDEDETYFVNGSGSFNAQGFSGTYVETVTAAEETQYIGVSCAYSFSNVAPASGDDGDDEPGESDAE
jgi:hypothetical protein